MGDSRQKSAPEQGTQYPPIAPWAPVSATAMEIDTTASRHTAPRNWLRSVEWLIAAGLHPKANHTTLTVAQDLAKRMDYSTGHVRYGLEDMAVRLDLDRSNVARHVKYLRQLGALVWAQHGSRSNIKRILGRPGYAATATVYAATIPAAYDHAMGHRVIGQGYEARAIAVRQETTVAGGANGAESAVDNSSSGPVDNPAKRSCATPSLTPATYDGKPQTVGGINYTPHAGRRTESAPHQTRNNKRSNNDTHARRTPLQVAREIQETRRVRALVNWTQREPLRRLAYVLRPWFDRGWGSDRIADELTGMCLGWRPKQPATYIQATIARQDAHQAALEADGTHSVAWKNSTAARDRASLEALFALGQPTDDPAPHPDDIPADRYTDDDRLRARLNWNIWPEVARHYADDPDDALDLYGTKLCCYANRKDAETRNREYTSA